MSREDLAERLDAVERRLDAAYPDAADCVEEERVEEFADRLADLEAAVEAIEGYVGEIERVDGELERRADAALAATDDLESTAAVLESATEELREDHEALADRVDAIESGGEGVAPRRRRATGPASATPDRSDDAGFRSSTSPASPPAVDARTDDAVAPGATRQAPPATAASPDGGSAADRWTATRATRSAQSGEPPGCDPVTGRAGRQPAATTAMPADGDDPATSRAESPGRSAPDRGSPDCGPVSGWGSRPAEADTDRAHGSDPGGHREADPPSGVERSDWGDPAEEATLLGRLRALL